MRDHELMIRAFALETARAGGKRPYKLAREQTIAAFEEEYVRDLLIAHAGNISRAARSAGIDRAYLHRLIKRYGLESIRRSSAPPPPPANE